MVVKKATISRLLPPLSPEAYNRLRDDIARHGVLNPITVDQRDIVIDGHNRQRIAEELGVECPVHLVVTANQGDAIEKAWALNEHRRQQLSEEARVALADRLRKHEGWSDRRIAEMLGVSNATISRDSLAVTDVTAKHPQYDTRGHRIKKSTAAEVETRRNRVVELFDAGMSNVQIARELDVSPSTVSGDIAARGRSGRGRRRPQTSPPPPPASKPRHRVSVMVHGLEGQVRAMRDENVVAQIAHDARDAYDLDDREWLDRAQGAASALLAYVRRVAEAVGSVEGAEAHLEDRDDLPAEWKQPSRPVLRAVDQRPR